ncbi:MAG TPA: glycosyltransferase family 4 protein [Candidatus Thermoplasmatota archaeon]|nr:glycosyltransferase family 4 protein [Candidatus Thermoplasmatota archaeon]
MRVVLFSHDGNLLGAQRMLLEYLEATAAEAEDRLVVSPTDGPLLAAVRALPRHRARVEPRPPFGEGKARAVVRRLRYILRLARLLRRERPDAVYVNTISHTSPLIAAWLARVPALVHVHEGRSFVKREFEPRMRFRVLRRLPRRVIAVSHATAGFLREAGVPDARIRVVHNGIHLPPARAPGPRIEVPGPPGAPVVGMVGQVTARKGIHHLVAAAEAMRGNGVQARFVVVGGLGDQAYVRDLRACIARAGLDDVLHLAGFQPDVDAWFGAFDVFVNPAVEEPFARVNLEAMAHGLPVVAADVDGTREAVAHGETGLLVPPADPAALASALTALVGDAALRRGMGERGRARVVERFTHAPYCRAISGILAETAGRR